jgi:DegV family protein with EDD domain
MSVKIIIDSACDLPQEMIKQLDVKVMPLLVYVDEVEYEDTKTIEAKEFYEKMREGSSVRTAQISVKIFHDEFIKYVNSDDEYLYISFSSGLSGTYQTAEMVRKELKETYPELKLKIYDSKCASVGLGMIVDYAVSLSEKGNNIDQIISLIDEKASRMEHIITVDDMEYLYRGGRISKSKALIGGMLNIKPIINMEKGELKLIAKARSKKKVIIKMLDIMEERGSNLSQQTIGIHHGDDWDTAGIVEQMIRKRFGVEKFIVTYAGCVLGAHLGPGALSVFFTR